MNFLYSFFFVIILVKSQIFKVNKCERASFCNKIIPCSTNGNCFVDLFQYYNSTYMNVTSDCVCDSGYISTPGDSVRCCYKQKSQLFAFILEFSLGFGFGHFYVGNSTLGTVKLCGCLLIVAIVCFIGILSCYKEGDFDVEFKKGNTTSGTTYLLYGAVILFAVWQIIDCVLFGINFYLDGNGSMLHEW